MKYSEFFWKHIDILCSDTSLARSFGEKVWNHKQQEINRLKAIIVEATVAIEGIDYWKRSGNCEIALEILKTK